MKFKQTIQSTPICEIMLEKPLPCFPIWFSYVPSYEHNLFMTIITDSPLQIFCIDTPSVSQRLLTTSHNNYQFTSFFPLCGYEAHHFNTNFSKIYASSICSFCFPTFQVVSKSSSYFE